MSHEACTLPLPDHAHIPGKTPRHLEGTFDRIKELTPPVTTDKDAAHNIAWLYGLRLIEQKYYWEAHEVLEPVWLNAPHNSREKSLVQSMIHIANAALKVSMDRPSAARKLSFLAHNCVSEAFAGYDAASLMLLTREQALQMSNRCCEADFEFEGVIPAL